MGRMKYDQFGNVIEVTSFDSDLNLFETLANQYDYDKEGNWVKQVTYRKGIPEFVYLKEIECLEN